MKEIKFGNKDIDMTLIEKNRISHLQCHQLTHLLQKRDVSCHMSPINDKSDSH